MFSSVRCSTFVHKTHQLKPIPVFIATRNRNGANAMQILEYGIGALVLVVFVIMAVLVGKIHPPMIKVLDGYVPSATLVKPDALVYVIRL